MKLWILYSRFTDDPSLLRGVFTSEAAAVREQEAWTDPNSEIVEIDADTVLTRPSGRDLYLA